MGRWLSLARQMADACDNSDNSANSTFWIRPIDPFVTIVTKGQRETGNGRIAPHPQNNCSSCGEFIPVYNTNWIHTTDGTLVHHGAEHGDACLKHWQDRRKSDNEIN